MVDTQTQGFELMDKLQNVKLELSINVNKIFL